MDAQAFSTSTLQVTYSDILPIQMDKPATKSLLDS